MIRVEPIHVGRFIWVTPLDRLPYLAGHVRTSAEDDALSH
jgi:hypothetical protein